ncbi:MAG TPA: hypothetical protein VHC20_08155 [Candidatus Paceibacterota bacterium]|nr:hypothetical protein [Candidatus Paceibacterota bacterium]
MSHDKHVRDGVNKDVGSRSLEEARDYYLKLLKRYRCPYPKPLVTMHEGVRVVREDKIVGSKARAADPLLAACKQKKVVYVQPRTGLAGISLISVAENYDKEVHLFMPASKKISYHQACTIERGATPHFYRIVAMPNLNRIARKWSEENDALFVPLGLQHELATAGLVLAASQVKPPEEVYVATSTGVLTRALQIAWPKARFVSVCVARNMKAGELGRAKPISHTQPFNTPAPKEKLPPFPTVPTYDGKVWQYVPKNSGRDVLFWNVGTDPVLKDPTIIDRVDGWRDWVSTKPKASSLFE